LALIDNLAQAFGYQGSSLNECLLVAAVDLLFLFASCFPMTVLGLFELAFAFFTPSAPILSTKQAQAIHTGFKSLRVKKRHPLNIL
jgi:hypothetical protein